MAGSFEPNRYSQGEARGGASVAAPVFRLLLGLEAQKAVRLQYCFSVVWIAFEAEGAELEMLLSRATDRWAPLALRQLRSTDVMTRLAPATLGVLLVDAETSAVPSILERLAEIWAGHPAGILGQLSWSAGAASYPRDGGGDDMLDAAERRMTRARTAGGNRLCAGLD